MKSLELMIICAFFVLLSASTKPIDYAENVRQYVDEYLDIAINEERKGGIPVSIKLGQALLETNYGKSDLIKSANNHFGLKCKDYWPGKTHYQIDDDRNQEGILIPSCFRSYASAEQSYADHTTFLMSTPSYKRLFTIPSEDYRAWALGLQQGGYASDDKYASKLIKIIEANGLEQLTPTNKEIVHETLHSYHLKKGYKRGYFIYNKKN